jgi:hypothetical protein
MTSITIPPWLQESISPELRLALWQQFGLAFLLGSFAVATLSDLKRMSAQREFVEIWLAFLVVMLALDAYEGGMTHSVGWEYLAVKWGLIAVFSLLSFRRVGVLFRLAFGDVAALAAAACLLSPVLIVLLYVSARVLAVFAGPLLRRGRQAWPFMPVVSLATLAILGLALLLQRGF